MKRDLLDLSVELDGVSAALYVLSENFEPERERTVSDKSVCAMLHAIFSQVSRISEDLLAIDAKQ